MLKTPASGVLASLRGSTYRSVRLASSLAAALLDGRFEHSAYNNKCCGLNAEIEDNKGGERVDLVLSTSESVLR
jgi:hypothetical protein